MVVTLKDNYGDKIDGSYVSLKKLENNAVNKGNGQLICEDILYISGKLLQGGSEAFC